jgi:hypothetical protein
MQPNRTDLNRIGQKRLYQTTSLVLISLSLIGVIGLLLFLKVRSNPNVLPPGSIPYPSPQLAISPTDLPPDLLPSPEPTAPLPDTTTPTIPPNPSSPSAQFFQSEVDKFRIYYSPARKLYQDKENTGNRYTFYAPKSTITVHVGSNWSWVPPRRQFTADLLVSGQPTYRYDINQQTIVDFEVNGLKYTIQCFHNTDPIVKTECSQFLSDFSLM